MTAEEAVVGGAAGVEPDHARRRGIRGKCWLRDGVDFGKLDTDGRKKLICGFFRLWPELPRP